MLLFKDTQTFSCVQSELVELGGSWNYQGFAKVSELVVMEHSVSNLSFGVLKTAAYFLIRRLIRRLKVKPTYFTSFYKMEPDYWLFWQKSAGRGIPAPIYWQNQRCVPVRMCLNCQANLLQFRKMRVGWNWHWCQIPRWVWQRNSSSGAGFYL